MNVRNNERVLLDNARFYAVCIHSAGICLKMDPSSRIAMKYHPAIPSTKGWSKDFEKTEKL
jgi:hypothetical protein